MFPSQPETETVQIKLLSIKWKVRNLHQTVLSETIALIPLVKSDEDTRLGVENFLLR